MGMTGEDEQTEATGASGLGAAVANRCGLWEEDERDEGPVGGDRVSRNETTDGDPRRDDRGETRADDLSAIDEETAARCGLWLPER